MDYIKIRFGNDVEHISARCKLIEEMFSSINPMFCLSERSWKPQMDIYENEESIIILADIAGVNKDDLEIEISNKAVKICGTRLGIHPEKDAKYRLAEIQYGKFERILFLPLPIDTEKVTASYTNGFLHINLGKLSFKKMHKITIENG